MNLRPCCQIKTRLRRGREMAGWIIPGAILALLPKCPVCLVAYAAVWTGIGISFSAAMHLRMVLMTLCIGLIVFLAARNTLRLVHKFGQQEKIIRRRAIC